MAVFQDPAGAFLGVWQADRHAGAELVNEPGAFCWNELATRDPDRAGDFYAKVFGWEPHRADDSGGMDYTEFRVGGESIAGMMPMADRYPAGMPPHWMVYFAVGDCDAAVARATDLGATVFVPPQDVPVGRFAIMADPQQAAFAVIALAPGD
jgi:predicted enzyme related to lactoylglutathione lyase